MDGPLKSLCFLLFFVDWKYNKETGSPKVSKRVVICFKSFSLIPLDQLEPNLVGVFIRCSSKKFMLFADQMYTKGPKVSKKGIVCVCF
jgi:hypothetical protein